MVNQNKIFSFKIKRQAKNVFPGDVERTVVLRFHWAHIIGTENSFVNPPPRSGWGIIKMAVVCPFVRPSVCPSVTLSYPLHISWTVWKIFIKLWSNVCLSESMCRTHKSTMPTQGQGHRSRSCVWALNFMSDPYLLYPWKDFFFKTLVICLPQWDDVQKKK